MSWWQIALIVLGVLVVYCLAGIYCGMAIDASGADDRDETKPADLWAGYERRKVKPYE